MSDYSSVEKLCRPHWHIVLQCAHGIHPGSVTKVDILCSDVGPAPTP